MIESIAIVQNEDQKRDIFIKLNHLSHLLSALKPTFNCIGSKNPYKSGPGVYFFLQNFEDYIYLPFSKTFSLGVTSDWEAHPSERAWSVHIKTNMVAHACTNKWNRKERMKIRQRCLRNAAWIPAKSTSNELNTGNELLEKFQSWL